MEPVKDILMQAIDVASKVPVEDWRHYQQSSSSPGISTHILHIREFSGPADPPEPRIQLIVDNFSGNLVGALLSVDDKNLFGDGNLEMRGGGFSPQDGKGSVMEFARRLRHALIERDTSATSDLSLESFSSHSGGTHVCSDAVEDRSAESQGLQDESPATERHYL